MPAKIAKRFWQDESSSEWHGVGTWHVSAKPDKIYIHAAQDIRYINVYLTKEQAIEFARRLIQLAEGENSE